MLRKTAWLLDVLGLGAVALVLALIAGNVLDGRLAAQMVIPVRTVSHPDVHMTLDANRMARAFGGWNVSPERARGSRPPLRAHLSGTLVCTDPRWSWALVSDDAGARPLLIGDALGDGILAAIDSDRVTIRRGEQLEVLGFGLTPTPPPGAANDLTHAGRDGLLGNPGIFSDARFVPAMVDGQVVGLRASAVRPGGIYARLGLQDGDLVRSIDGIDAGNLPALIGHLPALLQASRVEVELGRDGTNSRVAVELRN